MRHKAFFINLFLISLLLIIPRYYNAHAQEADLQVMDVVSNNIQLLPAITSASATTVQNGSKGWFSIIENDSQMPITNTALTIMSGYDPALFNDVTSFPYTYTVGTIEPGQIQFVNRPIPAMIPVLYTLGFDSSKEITPTTIPVGGTQQTVKITVTLVDEKYITQGGSFNILVHPNSNGVTLVSLSDPTNLDQGEEVNDMPDQMQWQLGGNLQLNKPYTFTAVLNIPNQTGASFEFQPDIQIDGQTEVPGCEACTGTSVTILDPMLDGSIPGSGSITYSIAEGDHIWTSKHADISDVVYQGVQPTIIPGPTSKNECKKGGWKNFGMGPIGMFKNQGDCVSYVVAQNK